MLLFLLEDYQTQLLSTVDIPFDPHLLQAIVSVAGINRKIPRKNIFPNSGLPHHFNLIMMRMKMMSCQ